MPEIKIVPKAEKHEPSKQEEVKKPKKKASEKKSKAASVPKESPTETEKPVEKASPIEDSPVGSQDMETEKAQEQLESTDEKAADENPQTAQPEIPDDKQTAPAEESIPAAEENKVDAEPQEQKEATVDDDIPKDNAENPDLKEPEPTPLEEAPAPDPVELNPEEPPIEPENTAPVEKPEDSKEIISEEPMESELPPAKESEGEPVPSEKAEEAESNAPPMPEEEKPVIHEQAVEEIKVAAENADATEEATPAKEDEQSAEDTVLPKEDAEKSDDSEIVVPTPVEIEPQAASQPNGGAKGMQITQIFADRLAPPDAKALNDIPIPKEGEGFSIRLHPAYFFEFLNHPFTVNREVKDYKDLYESIKENGINEPVKARPRAGGGLELISGHRRHDIAMQLNYPVPTVIVQVDDDTAQIEVVDGNLHRQDIPTSELARAAKMKMDALSRKAGRRSKMEQLTSPAKRTDQQVAEDMGMSRNQVNRLVRIDSLVPDLKQQVDDKKLPFNTAVELSYLKQDEQEKVVDFMKKEQIVPSMAQATALKDASRHAETLQKVAPSYAGASKVDEKKIESIIKPAKKEPEIKVTITGSELREFFDGKIPTVPEAKSAIMEGLRIRQKAMERQQKKQETLHPSR